MLKKEEKEEITPAQAPTERGFTRQPAWALSRLAFWMFFIGTLSGIGGSITLAITSGVTSIDMILATVTSFVCLVLVATRMRWMQILSLVLSLFLIYQILTQPYVLSSIMAPKTDPDGGFGHFVGVVVLSMCVLLGFFANIGLVLQNYRQGPRRTPRWLGHLLSGIIGLALGALLIGALVQPAAGAGTLYTNGVPTVHMSAGGFVQSSVTITKGSKLLLVDDVAAVHIIANGSWQNGSVVQANEAGAPVVNNVQISSGSIEIGPFATAGTYHIYCKVHQGMNLIVIVQ